MRRAILAALAVLALSGCISTIDSAYDEQARRQCENGEVRSRGECHDRADRQRQQRDQD